MASRGIKILFWFSLIVLLFLIYKYYWKIQIMYNSSILSFYTPDYFPCINEKLVEQKSDIGEKICLSKRIVIATMLRDVEDRIPEIIKKAEKMGSQFQDYHILVVENDSADNTRKLLLSWAKRNPRVTILGCGRNEKECRIKNTPKTEGHSVDRSRIEKMVKLRNIYLKEIKENFGDWDIAAFWDADLIGSIYLDGIHHSMEYLENNPDVDLVCSYGIYRWSVFTLFYDTYAYVEKGEDFHIDDKILHDVKKGIFSVKYSRGEDPVEVDSCFSGFSLYKISSLIPPEVVYDMSPPGNIECEHSRLNKKIAGKKVMNPSMIHLVLENK